MPAPRRTATTDPILIDCDPGHDDAIAILLAGRTLDVRAITAVHGNAPLARTQVNARRVVELGGLSIPVAAGAEAPLVRQASYAPEVHGASGLDGPDLPEPSTELVEAHAVDVIIEESKRSPGLHLVAVGPLTNVALALRKDPALPGRLSRISLMGGSLTWGNVTPAAEFNIWCDPDAADIVFSSGVPITMVGLNVTMQVIGTPERRAQLRTMGGRVPVAVADMLDHYAIGEGQYSGLPGGALHDPIVIAALIDPSIIETLPLHVAVETSGKLTAGMTLCDGRALDPATLRPRGTRRSDAAPANADVAVAVDVDRFWDLLLAKLGEY